MLAALVLVSTLRPPVHVDSNAAFTYALRYTNTAATNAANVPIVAKLAQGETFLAARNPQNTFTCSDSAGTVTCNASLLWPHETGEIFFDVRTPPYRAGHVTSSFTIDDAQPVDVTFDLYRPIVVGNNGDDGFGSLRDAIRDANTSCDTAFCKIVFAIPPDVSHRITLRTPLPDITGRNVVIDGTTMELNGAQLKEGDGLVIRSTCEHGVYGMNIHDFPGVGIALAPPPHLFLGECIAGDRGIESNTLNANRNGVTVFGDDVSIRHNTIAGNRRSGIFIESGSPYEVVDNRIDNNGASGIFINDRAGFTEFARNTITNNRQFGVAIAPFALEAALRENAISGNGLTAIDYRLDLATPNEVDDSNRVPNAPVLRDAVYDPVTDRTIVTGRIDSASPIASPAWQWWIEVFSSSSPNQAEKFAGTLSLSNGHADFTLIVDGNLSGKWITATNTRARIFGFASVLRNTASADATSELSNAIPVR